MKQYKLIKTFPGSPELGTIVENKNGSIYFPQTKETLSSTELNYFDKIITNHPEFWEEVVEKEVVFKTEDGVDVYENDTVFAVENNPFFT